MKFPIPFLRHLLLGVFLFLSLSISAQYSSDNSFMLRALVKYDLEANGLYGKKENLMVTEVSNEAQPYAFDRKTSNLYVLTTNGNFEITLNKDYARIVKNNSRIPQLHGEELNQVIDRANAQLAQHFAQLNQQILDKRAANRRIAIADSLAKEREMEEARAAIERKRAEYRATHQWSKIPIGGHQLSCQEEDCDNTYQRDTVLCFAIKNDTILYINREELNLGIKIYQIHYTKIPQSLQQDEAFNYHLLVFKDSIDAHSLNISSIPTLTKQLNAIEYASYIDELRKMAPYGFIVKWSWDNEVTVSLQLKYFNSNKKRIKYIEVHWAAINDVGDVRGRGSFRGTGPLGFLESGSWDWDRSLYFVADDATTMRITKVILTYMNGTKKILTGDAIVIDDSE